MPRIPLITPDNMTSEQRRAYDAIVGTKNRAGRLPAPFRMALHSPEFAEKLNQLGELLHYRTRFTPYLSELAILVTARQWDSQHVWYAHEKYARQGGVPPTVIEAIRMQQRPSLERADAEAVYDYATELHEKHFVSEAVYRRALDMFGVAGVVELTGLVGYYVMVAMALNAHEYPLPEGVAPPLAPRASCGHVAARQ